MEEYNTLSDRLDVARLFGDLRSAAPVGAIGLLEFRNMLANLFPWFEEVRDEELDEALKGFIENPPASALDGPYGGFGPDDGFTDDLPRV